MLIYTHVYHKKPSSLNRVVYEIYRFSFNILTPRVHVFLQQQETREWATDECDAIKPEPQKRLGQNDIRFFHNFVTRGYWRHPCSKPCEPTVSRLEISNRFFVNMSTCRLDSELGTPKIRVGRLYINTYFVAWVHCKHTVHCKQILYKPSCWSSCCHQNGRMFSK
jgi:hypothetical protein